MTKTLSRDVAEAFIENMRWFANVGRISWKVQPNGRVRVTANEYAWSMFMIPKEEEGVDPSNSDRPDVQ